MALTPGLQPFREDRQTNLERDKRNVEQKELRQRTPSLRPTAAPTETYHRPAPVQRDTNLEQFADSLAALNPALARFGSATREEKKDNTESAVAAKLMGKSPEEQKKIIDSDPEIQGELGRAAAMRFHAKTLAARTMEQTGTEYENGFDKTNGDFNDLIQKNIKPILDQYGNDPIFRKTFMEDIQPGMQRMQSSHAAFRSSVQKEQTNQATSDVFMGTVRKGEADGQKPEDIAGSIFREFYGNEKLLKMGYGDQMKALAGVVEKLAAEGKYDVVKAIAETDRKDASGGHVGKLLDNTLIGSNIASALIKAKQVQEKVNHESGTDTRQGLFDRFSTGQATEEDEQKLRDLRKASPGIISEATEQSWIAHARTKREALARQAAVEMEQAQLNQRVQDQEVHLSGAGIEAMKEGRLFSLPQMVVINKKGEEETLTPEKFRERAITDYQEHSNRYAQQNKETFEQKLLREAPVFANNGVVPKEWKDTFVSGSNAISAAAIHGKELPEPAVKAYSMYKLLRANNSQMLRDLIPKDQRDIYEAWRVGEEELHIDPRKAVILATEINKDPTDRFNRASTPAVKEIKKQVESFATGYTGWATEAANGSELASKIGQRAEWYAKLGLNADKSIELATKSVKDTHVNINGWWIDASDRRIGNPQDFVNRSTEVLQDYARKYGKAEGIEASDLTIREVGTGYGSWRIVHKVGGLPVDNPADSVFTMNDLQLRADAAKAAKDKADLATMEQNAKRKPPALKRVQTRKKEPNG